MTRPVIFLDFDGPLISTRAFWYRQKNLIVDDARWNFAFDPVAAAMIDEVATKADAQYVISSSWRRNKTRADHVNILNRNGMTGERLHKDWSTLHDYGGWKRSQEIKHWLANHLDVTVWAALDDEVEKKDLTNIVQVDPDDGLTMANLRELRRFLGLPELTLIF